MGVLHRKTERRCRSQAAHEPRGRFDKADGCRGTRSEVADHRRIDEKHHRRGDLRQNRGYRKTDDIMREQYGDAIKLLRKGISLRNVSKLCDISVNTVRKCKALV